MSETETPATPEGIHVFQDAAAATKWVDDHMIAGKPDPMVAAIYYEVEGAPAKRTFKALGKNDRIEMKSLVDKALRVGKEPGVEYAGVKYFAYDDGGRVVGGAVQWRPGSARWPDVAKASPAQLARWRQRAEEEAEAAAPLPEPDTFARPARINPQSMSRVGVHGMNGDDPDAELTDQLNASLVAAGYTGERQVIVTSPHDAEMARREAEPPTIPVLLGLLSDWCAESMALVDEAARLHLETVGTPPDETVCELPATMPTGWRALGAEYIKAIGSNVEIARRIIREARGL